MGSSSTSGWTRPEGYAREVGRVESRLLWAHKQGMDFPPYILKALQESVELYRERLERGLGRRCGEGSPRV